MALSLIREHNLSKLDFRDKDFVTENDVLCFIDNDEIKKQDLNIANEQTEVMLDVESIKVSKMKRLEIDYLIDIQSSNLTSTASIKVDAEGLTEYAAKKHNYFRYSVAPLVVKSAAILLKKYKNFNAFYNYTDIKHYNNINVGYATDGDFGLKVLTLENTDKLNIEDIDALLFEMIGAYKNNSLSVSEVTNSTFTITDLSAEGVSFFKPLVNQKQSAILGISSIDETTNSFYLTVTFDHRVATGKEAGSFLRELKQLIEEEGNSLKVEKENDIQEMFRLMEENLPEFTENFVNMSQSNLKDNSITKKQKKLILIALGVYAQCGWCIDLHIEHAINMGIDESEIIEAATQAVIMGGGPKMMYMIQVFNAIKKLKKRNSM